MKHSKTRPLIALNLVLLGAIVTLGIVGHAGAQGGNQPARARGSYTMVSGRIQGGSNDVVYIIDSANQEVVSLGWDVAKGRFNIIGYRNLATDAQNMKSNR